MSLTEDLKVIKNAELDIEILSRENEKLCAKNNEEIANLQEKIKSIESIMEEELKISGENKMECKFDSYKGSIGWQKMPDKWIYKEKELWPCIKSLPDLIKTLFIKITVTMKKADLKKRIIDDNPKDFINGRRINYEPGLQLYLVGEKDDYKVEGIKIERQDHKFKYSIKKIK